MGQYKGSCHCGKVQFEVNMELKEGLSCNCSMCQRKGTILTFVPETQFKMISGSNELTDYQFGKKSIHHTFCSTCGVTAFASGKMPNGAEIKAVNMRCLDAIDLNQIKINHVNGKDF